MVVDQAFEQKQLEYPAEGAGGEHGADARLRCEGGVGAGGRMAKRTNGRCERGLPQRPFCLSGYFAVMVTNSSSFSHFICNCV